uniref:GBF-interacting protein 1 N-terminal domain-containing protein n=1 Tax=Brassica campestris TaxID=3711 RepID=A0A3P6BZL6_BRACM|nr:unnamed protein product [Brassica rapa]
MGSKGSVRKMIQSLKEIVNCSDSEIYTMLVECHMDPNETVIRLISQDAFQEVKSKRDEKKDTKDQAESSRRGIPNRGARNSAKSSYNTARGGGNKFNSNETRLAQRGKGARNHWAGSSAPNSDRPKNAEVKEAEPAGPTGAASSSLLPAPAYQSAWAKANPGKKTMAEIVKMGKPLHQKKVSAPRSSETQESGSKAPLKDEGSSTEKQESGSKAPLKDEGSSLEKQEKSGSKAPLKDEGSSFEMQDVSDPVPSLLKPFFFEPKTHADQVSLEPQHVDESQMNDEVLEAKTNQVAIHPDLDQVAQLSHLRFGSFGLIGSGRASSRFNYNLEDTKRQRKIHLSDNMILTSMEGRRT